MLFRSARMGEAGKRFTEEHFSLSRHLDTLTGLFADLVARRKSHG